MPPQPHSNIPPHPYPSMPPHPICLCPHCTSFPMYAPCEVAHHPHILELGYLHFQPPSILPSYMSTNLVPRDFGPCSSRSTVEHKKESRKQKN